MFRVRIVCGGMAAALTLALPGTSMAQSAREPAGPLTLRGPLDALVDRNLPVIAARHNVELFRAPRVAAALKPDPTVVFTATQFTLPRVLTSPRYAGFATAARRHSRHAVHGRHRAPRRAGRKARAAHDAG